MRTSNADADGVILDSHYQARVTQWETDRWRVFQPLVDEVVRLVGRGARVLDLGAGEGFFTKCCVENRLEAVALEGSAAAVEWAKRSLNIDARRHNLKDPLPFDNELVDVVMYHDVYEHVPDRVNRVVFSESFRVLKSRGFLWVITTCRYDFVECAEPEHINNPTPMELLRYGRRFGFTGEVLRPAFNISLFTPRFYDAEGRVPPWKRRLREFLKRYQGMVSRLFTPVWLPIWYANVHVLHLPALDFVAQNSNVRFQKGRSSARE